MSCHNIRATVTGTVAVLAGVFSLAGTASAQIASVTDVQRQVDDAFKEVMARADSADARERYARLLVQAGNFEGGIAALEGLLLSPDAPASIRLELAFLYYRLGSYALAEAYLREALADPRLDEALRQQANTLLPDVVRRNQTSHLSGSLMAGLRSQRNPTAASSAGQVLSAGVLVPRDDRTRPRSDVDAHLWGKLDHVYDLGAQNEAAVVTSLVGYANHFSSVDSHAYRPGNPDPFDVTAIAASSGIRFKPAPVELPGLTLRPHLILGQMLLNGHKYFTTAGLALDGNYRLSERLAWGGAYEARHFSYSSRPDIADSAWATGNEQSLRVRGAVETGVNRFLTGEIGFIDRGAGRSYLEFRGTEAKLAYSFSYANPLTNSGVVWTTTLSGSALRRHFRGADPAIDPTIRRRDTERRISLVNSMPLARDLALQVQFEYTDAPSNLPNYEYSNFSGAVGVMWKF